MKAHNKVDLTKGTSKISFAQALEIKILKIFINKHLIKTKNCDICYFIIDKIIDQI